MAFNDLRPQHQNIRTELDAALAAVLTSGRFLLGQQGEAFEQEFAAYCSAAHGVGVASGTDALRLALLALGVQPGDEVITVANAGVPPVAAIVAAGARPRFVDVDPVTRTLDPRLLEEAITERARAVLVVHLYGHPADLQPLLQVARQHGLKVLEDCAQAHGAQYRGRRVGALTDAAAFSFYPTKNLGALGDAGMVLTNDEAAAEQLRLLRHYGWRVPYASELHSTNSRLDELQAALLRVKLKHLDRWNAARQERACLYRDLMPRVTRPIEAAWAVSVHHLYVIQTEARDDLRRRLAEEGVDTAIHYPYPVHLQAPYAHFGQGSGSLPVTERMAREVLSLPLYPELPLSAVERVAGLVNDFGC